MDAVAARRRARDLARWVGECRPGDQNLLRKVSDELAPILGTPQTLAYGIDTRGEQLRLAFVHSPFEGAATVRRDWSELLARIPLGATSYDPRCPERWQRNVPVTFADLRRYDPDPSATPVLQMAARHGFSTVDQMRVLICDGPSLLAWVGATREHPFSEQEVRLLRTVTRPLRTQLTLERRLGIASIAWPAMEAALDASPAAAVLVRAPCSVQHCNAAAATLLAQDRVAFLDGLREAVAGRGDATWLTTRLDVDGPRHFLAVRRLPPADPAPRAAAAARRLKLSPRQAQTLALVAQGQANATIAAAFGCSETAVEMHVTALLRRFQVRNRAELVARFWTELG